MRRVPGPWALAVSLLAHAALLALPWQRTTRPEAPAPQRMTVRLLARSLQAAPAAAAPVALNVAPKSATPRKVAKARPAAPRPAAPMAPPAAAKPIDGSVFGMPRIGFASASSTRWMTPPPPPLPLAHAGPSLAAQLHAARQAGREQIVSALQRRVAALSPPTDAAEAACALHASPEARLDCDSDALRQVVSAQSAALSGMLDAYRGTDPGAHSLSIAYSQGRYHVSLNALR